ncbi:MAG TPA: hypothetical protein VF543_04310 [Pyrinomonadaceae bacterium]
MKAIQAARRLNELLGVLNSPEIRVMSYEAHIIQFQLGNKAASSALIPIRRSFNSAVNLVERLKLETRKPEPGSTHVCLLPNSKIQAPNREQISQRAEVKVKVYAICHLVTLLPVEPPPAGRVN